MSSDAAAALQRHTKESSSTSGWRARERNHQKRSPTPSNNEPDSMDISDDDNDDNLVVRRRNRQKRSQILSNNEPDWMDISDDDDDDEYETAVVAWLGKSDPNEDDDDDDDYDIIKLRREQEKKDLQFAIEIQRYLHQESIRHEEEAMTKSTRGKAWKFVESVFKIHQRFLMWKTTTTTLSSGQPITIEPIAIDDMVYLAERMIVTLDEFRTRMNGEGCRIDIGYHYTQSQNLNTIKTDGLLTKAERGENKIHANFNGAKYGDGIYTASSPKTTCKYGDVGLMVARLRGREIIYEITTQQLRDGDGFDSLVRRFTSKTDFVVLKKSCQCLALIKFPSTIYMPVESTTATATARAWAPAPAATATAATTMASGIPTSTTTKTSKKAIHLYQCELQKLIDEAFNGGSKTIVQRY